MPFTSNHQIKEIKERIFRRLETNKENSGAVVIKILGIHVWLLWQGPIWRMFHCISVTSNFLKGYIYIYIISTRIPLGFEHQNFGENLDHQKRCLSQWVLREGTRAEVLFPSQEVHVSQGLPAHQKEYARFLTQPKHWGIVCADFTWNHDSNVHWWVFHNSEETNLSWNWSTRYDKGCETSRAFQNHENHPPPSSGTATAMGAFSTPGLRRVGL